MTRTAPRSWTARETASLAGPFPLIARPALPCVALETRVAQLVEILDGPLDSFPGTELFFATHALSRAAALASECQRPQEANSILRRHLSVYTEQDTLSVPAALAMLEVATDLARFNAMRGHPDRAAVWLTRLMHAVRTGSSISIDRYALPLDRVEGEAGEHQILQGWAWARLLGDAVKILSVAGRRSEAADLAIRSVAPSARMTETRQAVIVDQLLAGDLAGARLYLDQAQPTHQWEVEVASCLAVLAAEPADRADAAAAMLSTFQRSAPAPGYAAYRARYGVTVTRLAHATGHSYAPVARQLATEAIASGDAHAARVLRSVAGCLPRRDVATLDRNITRAGLRGEALTGHHLSRLRVTTDRAITTLLSLQTET